jgi:hypothetical protein
MADSLSHTSVASRFLKNYEIIGFFYEFIGISRNVYLKKFLEITLTFFMIS